MKERLEMKFFLSSFIFQTSSSLLRAHSQLEIRLSSSRLNRQAVSKTLASHLSDVAHLLVSLLQFHFLPTLKNHRSHCFIPPSFHHRFVRLGHALTKRYWSRCESNELKHNNLREGLEILIPSSLSL